MASTILQDLHTKNFQEDILSKKQTAQKKRKNTPMDIQRSQNMDYWNGHGNVEMPLRDCFPFLKVKQCWVSYF